MDMLLSLPVSARKRLRLCIGAFVENTEPQTLPLLYYYYYYRYCVIFTV